MNFEIYAIKDQVTGIFGQPWLTYNRDEAVRRFNYVCSQAQMVARDSQLYRLGTFNNETGDIETKVDFIMSYTEPEVQYER